MTRSSRAWRRCGLLPALLQLALAAPACSHEPLTQIVVVVDSDWNGFDRITVQIDGFTKTNKVEAKLADDPLPRRVVLVHDGGPTGPLSVTVRAFVQGVNDAVLTEPRTRISFTPGKTLVLRIDLLFECLTQACDSGEACIAGPRCVGSNSASHLVPWTGSIDPLDVAYHVKAGDVFDAGRGDGAASPQQGDAAAVDDAGAARADTGVHGATDGSLVDRDAAPPIMSTPQFTFTPSNFDPAASTITALARSDVELNCGQSEFDSTDLSFANWCGKQPQAIAFNQAGGTSAALLVMDTLRIASGSALLLKGNRPVILAVFGDARIEGSIDASARGATAGPGADTLCTGGKGSSGTSGMNASAGGGSGGGFGSPGGAGGTSEQTGTSVSGGIAVGNASLTPLRGGCSGGRGGVSGFSAAATGGAGGGAVQLSAAGKLSVSGTISAGGGGGGVGAIQQLGGGGGGSGGAILLESADTEIQASAVIAANGGAGGAGQQRSFAGLSAKAGADGAAGEAAAAGGTNAASVGTGGAGAALAGDALPGGDGSSISGGGGGGGGAGRIRIGEISSCVVPGIVSPPASVTCSACGSCPTPPALGCHALDYGGRVYYRCDRPLALQSARARCQAAGLDVVEIDNSAENDWLRAQLSQDTWIGASDAMQEGTWLWLHNGAVFWMGSDRGVPVAGAFNAWLSGEPNNTVAGVTNADCAAIGTDGFWRDHACDGSYPYFCK